MPTIPESITLFQNYPNPFNASTTIRFDLPYDSHVKLIVYDIAGREISALVNEKKSAGYHSVIWNPGNVASGMYIYILKTKNFSKSGKMVFEK
ncbi:T9SS type A sorting domain-containing protein [bacterium]|nr:T9SS type A sorting domain-containing protein [bacterium]